MHLRARLAAHGLRRTVQVVVFRHDAVDGHDDIALLEARFLSARAGKYARDHGLLRIRVDHDLRTHAHILTGERFDLGVIFVHRHIIRVFVIQAVHHAGRRALKKRVVIQLRNRIRLQIVQNRIELFKAHQPFQFALAHAHVFLAQRAAHAAGRQQHRRQHKANDFLFHTATVLFVSKMRPFENMKGRKAPS